MAIEIKSAMLVAPMVMVLALAAAAGMVNAEMMVTGEVKIKSNDHKCLTVLKGRAMPKTAACNNADVLQKLKKMEWIGHSASDNSHLYTFVNKGTGQALKSVVASESVTLTSNNISVNSPYDASIAWTTPGINGLYAIRPAQNGNLNLITGDLDYVYLSDAWFGGDGQEWDFVS